MVEVLAEKPEVEAPAPPPAPVEKPKPGITGPRRAIILAAPVAAMALSWGGGAWVQSQLNPEQPVEVAVSVEPPDGIALYAQHCAQCHGERGNARGISQLDPPARYFGKDQFKFATTLNGVPTDNDLLHILQRGIPGSAMPSFGQLPEEQLQAIIGHVRDLTWQNTFAVLRDKEIDELGDYIAPEVAERTAKRTTPGQPLEIPAKFTVATPEVLTSGRKIYLQNCAPCHGSDGHGDGPTIHKDANGNPIKPRDLTQGLYKGGAEPEHLYARIFLGIPGTPMPATKSLSPRDMDALIAYIQSLSGASVATGGLAGHFTK